MITLIIICSLLVLFIVGLLFIPISISVNTRHKSYYIKLPGYFRIDLLFGDGYSPVFRLKVFFLTFKISPVKREKKIYTEKEKPVVKPKDEKKHSFFKSFTMVKPFLKAFRVKRLEADIDTGDFPLNAQLIPVVARINESNINLSINFNNQNSADILIKTQIFRFIKPIYRYYLLTK